MSLYDVKNKFDNFLYLIFNFFSEVMFYLNFPARGLTSKNFKYKGRHKGESCFIIGTGPSLKDLSDEDFARINSGVVFGVSSLFKSDAFAKLNIDYYCMIDNVYWGEQADDLKNISSYFNAPPVLITDWRARGVIGSGACGLSDVIYLHTKKFPLSGVNYDLCGNVSAVNNVVSYCILAAMYMGFENIYLIGCDYNSFCSYGVGHCYDDESAVGDYNLEYYLYFFAITTRFHYEIAKTAKLDGVEIVNLTKGSLLDAYPRADF